MLTSALITSTPLDAIILMALISPFSAASLSLVHSSCNDDINNNTLITT